MDMLRRMPKAGKPPRVVITGMGPITALGAGVVSLWDAFQQKAMPAVITQQVESCNGGRTQYRMYSPTPEMLRNLQVPGVYVDRLREWYGESIDPDHLNLIQAIKLALDDSGLRYDEERNDISLFLLHENPGIEKFFSECLGWVFDTFVKPRRESFTSQNRAVTKDKATFLANTYKQLVQGTYNLQPFMFLYALTKAFKFHGYSLYVNNACASGLFAMESAYRQLISGQSEVAVVAGIDWPSRYPYKNLWFDWEGLYSSREAITPFTSERDGFLLGDAACALIFEEYEHALSRNASVYAEYVGGGFDLEGWKVTIPSGTPESYVRCVRRALNNAGVLEDEIDLINPHGVSTGVGDAYESRGLMEIFGSSLKEKMLVSLKPLLGHTLGVCGLAETTVVLLMLKKQLVVAGLDAKGTDASLHLELRNGWGSQPLRHALKISSGFAGYNGAAVFRAPTLLESRL